MKYITSRWGVACLAASWLMASGAVAQSVNPVSPTVNDLQAVVDKTEAPLQLSTINSITDITGGIELDVTFRVGQNTDPFAADFGQNFARISLEREAFSPPAGPLNWSAFDGYKLTIVGDIDMFVQPYLKTGASFRFFEPSGGGFGVGANTTTDVVQVFSNSRTFSPAFQDPAAVTDTNDVKAFGIQVIGNGVAIGQPREATIRITTDGVIPEPSTLALGSLGIAAIAAAARRRR